MIGYKYRVFLWILLLLTPMRVAAESRAHPFYLSLTEIRIDTDAHTLQVSCRMFSDDLEDAIKRLYSRSFEVSRTTDISYVERLLFNYIQQHLTIRVGETVPQLGFIGYEQEEDATWCYLEAVNIPDAMEVSVINTLLHDFLPLQVNMMHCFRNDVRKSTKLHYPEKNASFSFVSD